MVPNFMHDSYSPAFQYYFSMLPLYNTTFGAFREIIISRAMSGGRREIEFNFGSLPPIPGWLATVSRTNGIKEKTRKMHHNLYSNFMNTSIVDLWETAYTVIEYHIEF